MKAEVLYINGFCSPLTKMNKYTRYIILFGMRLNIKPNDILVNNRS